MSLRCTFSKKAVTVVFCILECIFFSGLLNGSVWMRELLKEDGYFMGSCNITKHNRITVEDVGSMMGILDTQAGGKRLKNNNDRRTTCVYKKVLRVVSLDEYGKITTTETIKSTLANKHSEKFNISNSTDNNTCSDDISDIEFAIQLVIIITAVLMVPIGIVLDRYGTSPSRISAM